MALHIASVPTNVQVGDLYHPFSNFDGRTGMRVRAPDYHHHETEVSTNGSASPSWGIDAFHPKFVNLAPSTYGRARRGGKRGGGEEADEFNIAYVPASQKEDVADEGDSIQGNAMGAFESHDDYDVDDGEEITHVELHDKPADRPEEITLGAVRRKNKNSAKKSRSHKYRSSLYLVVPEDHYESLHVMKLYILGDDGINIKAITEAVRGSFLYLKLIGTRLIELQVSAPYLAGFAAARKYAIQLLRRVYPEFLSSASPLTRIIQNRVTHNRSVDTAPATSPLQHSSTRVNGGNGTATTTAPGAHQQNLDAVLGHHFAGTHANNVAFDPYVHDGAHSALQANGNGNGFLDRTTRIDEEGRIIYYRRYGEEVDTPQRRSTRWCHAPNPAAGNRNDDDREYDNVYSTPPYAVTSATRAGRPNVVVGPFEGPEENRSGEGRFANFEARRETRYVGNSSSFMTRDDPHRWVQTTPRTYSNRGEHRHMDCGSVNGGPSPSHGCMPPYLELNPHVHQWSRCTRTSMDPQHPVRFASFSQQQQQQQEQAQHEFTRGCEEMRGTTRRLQPHVPQMRGTRMNNEASVVPRSEVNEFPHQRFPSGQPRFTENRVHSRVPRSNQAESMGATNQQQQHQRRQQMSLSQLVSPPNNIRVAYI